MSQYTKSTNFATKDNLSPGDPLKIVRGTEIDTEFNNISTAISTKTDNSAAAITGGSITGITDLAIADGGTGASTATAAINNLLPAQTSAANKYLQSDGTNVSWDAVTLSTADITGTLPVANGGTGVTSSTGTGNVVLSNSPTLVTPDLGTPASGVATNLTGLPISTGVSGLGTGVATFLATPSSANLASAVTDETGTGSLVFATSPTLVTPALGTPSALVGTNITGTASGLTAGNVTTNANLTGAVTSVGNATSLGSFSSANLLGALTDETGTGSAVFATSPTLVTPILGTPTSATLTNATGLPIATGVSGLGTGVATFLATPSSANLRSALTDETGTGSAVFATSPTLVTPALGTPSSGVVTNLTGTASININGTVGATTASTGAFTTLAASSSVTLSGGTANGVTYLNGSKVLTSGSALTFDGTTLNAKSVLLINDSQSYFGDNGVIGGGAADGNTTIRYFGGKYLAFKEGATEQMRLTSTGLGIGTSSPSAKLDVNGSAVFGSGAGNIAINLNGANTGTGNGSYIGLKNGGTLVGGIGGYSALFGGAYSDDLGIYFQSGKALKISDAGSSTLTFQSGNLGLGVTPSAWVAGSKAMQIGAVGAVYESSNGYTTIGYNAYEYASNAWKYIFSGGSAPASRYEQVGSGHRWYVAPSGSGGSVISFTQAMTLTSAGNLGVGATSPASMPGFVRTLQISSSSDASLRLTGSAGSWEIGNNSANNLQFYNGASSLPMTLDASGNLLLGATSDPAGFSTTQKFVFVGDTKTDGSGIYPVTGSLIDSRAYNSSSPPAGGGLGFGYKYTSGGATAIGPSIQGYKENTTDGDYGGGLRFLTRPNGGGPAERARIDSSGNLLVGTTTAAGKLTVSTSENTFGGNIAATNASYSSTVLQVQCSRDTSNATYYLIKGSRTGVADVFRVADSGNVTNTNNSYGAISDAKLKENVTDATPKLDKLNQVRVVNFNMIGDSTKQIGVIAQELETVFPSMVEESTDRDAEGNDLGTTTKSVKYSVFVPMLIKAMQEQQAIIESLKARLDAANL